MTWDTSSGEELVRLQGYRDEVRGVSVSPDGHHLASASGDKTIVIWNAAASVSDRHAQSPVDSSFAIPIWTTPPARDPLVRGTLEDWTLESWRPRFDPDGTDHDYALAFIDAPIHGY